MRKTNSLLIFKRAYGKNAVFVISVSCQQALWANICLVTQTVTYTPEMHAYVVQRALRFCMRHVRVLFNFGNAHVDSGTQCCGANDSKHFLQVFRIFP